MVKFKSKDFCNKIPAFTFTLLDLASLTKVEHWDCHQHACWWLISPILERQTLLQWLQVSNWSRAEAGFLCSFLLFFFPLGWWCMLTQVYHCLVGGVASDCSVSC